MLLVGDGDMLGDWHLQHARQLRPGNGGAPWTVEVPLTPGVHSFKARGLWCITSCVISCCLQLVYKHKDGRTRWEVGPNRIVQVPMPAPGKRTNVLLKAPVFGPPTPPLPPASPPPTAMQAPGLPDVLEAFPDVAAQFPDVLEAFPDERGRVVADLLRRKGVLEERLQHLEDLMKV